MTKSKRLIKEYANYDPTTFCDYLLIVAQNIEDSMLQAGGKPGKDYTFRDIYQLAVQHLSVNFSKNINYQAGYTSSLTREP